MAVITYPHFLFNKTVISVNFVHGCKNQFPECIKINYACCLIDQILRATLSLYMEDSNEQPLPTPEEVLVCNPTTTAEEVLSPNILHNGSS